MTTTLPATATAFPVGARVRVIADRYDSNSDPLVGRFGSVVETDLLDLEAGEFAVLLDGRTAPLLFTSAELVSAALVIPQIPVIDRATGRVVGPRHAAAEHAAPRTTRIGTRLHQLVEMTAAMDAKDARISELEAELVAERKRADDRRRALENDLATARSAHAELEAQSTGLKSTIGTLRARLAIANAVAGYTRY